MNFEVFCFDFVNNNLTVVQKEYFDTYAEAKAFERGEGRKYACGVIITPMNESAEAEMACVQCGGKWGSEYCIRCKYRHGKII